MRTHGVKYGANFDATRPVIKFDEQMQTHIYGSTAQSGQRISFIWSKCNIPIKYNVALIHVLYDVNIL